MNKRGGRRERERDVGVKWRGGEFHYALLKEPHVIQVRAAESRSPPGSGVLWALLNLNGAARRWQETRRKRLQRLREEEGERDVGQLMSGKQGGGRRLGSGGRSPMPFVCGEGDLKRADWLISGF